MNQTTIVAIVLGVLVLIAAVQAFQFSQIKNQLTEGTTTVQTTAAPNSGGGAALPSSLQNLPQMVGGC